MRRINGLALIVLVAGEVASLADEPTSQQLQRASRFVSKAAVALQAGNDKKATQYYRKSLDVLPDFPQAHLGLGHVAMRGRQFDEALVSYNLAHQSFADMGRALYELRLDRYNEAQQRIVQLEPLLSGSHDGLSGTGSAGWSVGQVRSSVVQVERSLQRLRLVERPFPKDGNRPPGELHFFVGNALANLGRMEEAVTAWEACVRAIPDFPLVYNNLAVASWQAGQVEAAWNYLQKGENLGFFGNPNFRAELVRELSLRPIAAATAD